MQGGGTANDVAAKASADYLSVYHDRYSTEDDVTSARMELTHNLRVVREHSYSGDTQQIESDSDSNIMISGTGRRKEDSDEESKFSMNRKQLDSRKENDSTDSNYNTDGVGGSESTQTLMFDSQCDPILNSGEERYVGKRSANRYSKDDIGREVYSKIFGPF